MLQDRLKIPEMKNPTTPLDKARRPFMVSMATLGAVGDLPWAPGTAGSALSVLSVAGLNLIPIGPSSRAIFMSLAAVLLFALGVPSAGAAEDFFQTHDPGTVVLDEFVGQLIPFVAESNPSWKFLLVGFVAFRFFDVLKPFPARRAERLPGGWGIMVDDVVAGLYALAVVLALGLLGR
jgi:phosphatidylglycerophosphatase A